MNNILQDVICDECGSIMILDDPEFLKCNRCGREMSVDEVRGIEENPGEPEE
ncbi:MAG: hypothetical protein V4469_00780 [Patescibacteria group bacterium]